MSYEPEDEATADRFGNGLVAGAMAFVISWNFAYSGFFSLGCAIFGFLLASGRLTSLVRTIDKLFNAGLNEPKTRGLEETIVATQADAERYWSSYDASKIWEQRSLELEAEAGMTTHYGQTRVLIPELGGHSLPPFVSAPRISEGEPLHQFWQRYDAANVRGNGLVFDPKNRPILALTHDEAQTAEVQLDYSHLPSHLALIEETKEAQRKLKQAAQSETGEFGADLTEMTKNVDIIVEALLTTPAKLGDVQRLFTYYLPEVAKLLAARQHMLALSETERVSEIEAILDRIEKAFAQFALRMHEADIRALDIDLKLLDRSLAAEFETQIGT
jgi:hypothetical protein